jgi:hypothetical protein
MPDELEWHGVTPEQFNRVLAYLEANGGILWEPDKRVGWAICPCCGEREFQICIPDGWELVEG